MKIEGRPAVNLADEMRWGTDPRIDDRRLPIDLALRVEHFMTKHYVHGEQDFNCFTFMRYVTGLYDGTSGIRHPTFLYEGVYTSPDTVTPGVPYIMKRHGELMHGVVGFTRTVCLSVLGDNQPLTWAPTSDLMGSYGCDKLMEVDAAIPTS
jgi:hypothetical protein